MQNVPNDKIVIPSGRVAPSGLVRLERRRKEIDESVWQRPDMRRLLASHDVAGVFRLLQRFGVSQRAIGARSGQSQSEVSEIIARGRRVVSYDVLERISVGFDLPRGWMGLAYDDETLSFVELVPGGAE
jgi:hypothetical protein